MREQTHQTTREHDPTSRHNVDDLIALGTGRQRIVVFTGAGISTESGIPDYRGPNGVWATQQPPTIGDFRTNAETRREYWKSRRNRFPELLSKRPNAGHLAITRLHEAGLVSGVITQNIDGLHQRSGMPSVRCHRASWVCQNGALPRLWSRVGWPGHSRTAGSRGGHPDLSGVWWSFESSDGAFRRTTAGWRAGSRDLQ